MSSQHIPLDIVFEILTGTKSLATLDTCKSVCKEWREMIYEPSFMSTYYKRTQNLSGFFFQGLSARSMFVSLVEEKQAGRVLDDIPRNVRILASCDQGILICVKDNEYYNGSGYSYRYYVCKPATKQWQPLPNPKLRYSTHSVSIIVLTSTPLRYKIIRLSVSRKRSGLVYLNKKLQCYYYCEIFDSKVWKWSNAQALLIPDPDSRLVSNDSSSGLVIRRSNSIYWLTNHSVVQFDYIQECFKQFPIPKVVRKYTNRYNKKNLVDYHGRLGLTRFEGRSGKRRRKTSKIALWLIENENHVGWSSSTMINWNKKLVVDIQNLDQYVSQLVAFYNAEIAFFNTFLNEVSFYEPPNYIVRKVKLRKEIGIVREVFQFRSDFEPVNLKDFDRAFRSSTQISRN